MGRSVNSVTLLGHIGRDPDVKVSQGGTVVADISIATNERRKDARGNWQDHAEWHYVRCFGKLAEIVRDYVRKGAQIYLEGRLQTQKWDDHGTTRYRTIVIGEEVVLLGGKQEGGGSMPPVDDGEEF